MGQRGEIIRTEDGRAFTLSFMNGRNSLRSIEEHCPGFHYLTVFDKGCSVSQYEAICLMVYYPADGLRIIVDGSRLTR